MADWRHQILKEFTPQIARVTLVADPDGLLLEEALVEAIRERGFELVPFEDPVAFRFAYETRFRNCGERDDTTDLVVVIRNGGHDLTALPYDLVQAGRRLSFSLGELFPGLSYPVVASLDRSDINVLYRARKESGLVRLGDDATKDFVLLHVFETDSALIKHPAGLLRVLLRRHYRGQRVPRILDDRFVHVLRKYGEFDSWPLETIIPNRRAFFSFLQERWPLFLDRVATSAAGGTGDDSGSFGLRIKGPAQIPFDHEDIRVYIDNLFIEGMLSPVNHESGSALRGKWPEVGILTDPAADNLRRLLGLMETVGDTIPDPYARHHDWLAFAYRWAELGVLWLEMSVTSRSGFDERIAELRTLVDRAFLDWMERRYAGLHNQPPNPPVMVHHAPRYLARQLLDDPANKIALVVADGLALEQWIVLRDTLAKQRPRYRFGEGAAFAWVPTITSVSRQAIFAGIPPFYFPSSIHTTNKEASLWTRFWMDQGLTARQVGYVKGLGDGNLDNVREFASRPEIRALGLVVDKVDKIMHGMELGAAGMLNQVRQWTEEGFMASLVDELLDRDFTICLTSDHGNIDAEGQGRPSEGVIADLRGERVRVYSDSILRSRVQERFPSGIAWPPLGLPEDYLALLAPGRTAFVREGNRIVGHGGISLEEVVVPMIQIERATT